MKSPFHKTVLALAALGVVAGVSAASAQQQPDKGKALKHYESGNKEFWTHPPDDWFLGDETEAQKGLAPPSGPPTGASDAELASLIKKIKLPEGFKIEVYASAVLAARQTSVCAVLKVFNAPDMRNVRNAGKRIALMMKRIKDDLSAFNVKFDSFVSERELSERVGLSKFVDHLKGLGHIFEEDGKIWFRSMRRPSGNFAARPSRWCFRIPLAA